MPKSIAEINQRIRAGEAVVVTAEEMIDVVAEKGADRAAAEVDVVTTGTFGPMCSSGALLCTGHSTPRMRFHRAWLNDVPAYTALAAVDLYLGATALPDGDPLNKVFPGRFKYGGGHVIEELVAGRTVRFRAESYGTDCYPARELETEITLAELNQAVLLNPRNGYQNYAVAVNRDRDRPLYTYMGTLQPDCGNANYCSAGQLSPLLNDPLYRTVGIGTRIFLGGGTGHVYWEGTQHSPAVPRLENGTPRRPAGTLGLCGDLKGMNDTWLRGMSMRGYGVSLYVGVGIPIPILDAEMARCTAVSDRDLVAPIVDYSSDYPQSAGEPLGEVSYAELRSGSITLGGREVRTASLSSYHHARRIAEELKGWIRDGSFLLAEPVAPLPGPESGQATTPIPMPEGSRITPPPGAPPEGDG